MGGCVSERGDLVVVAGNAVQGLCDVSCPLQNDLLRSAEKAEVLLFMCCCFFLAFALMHASWLYGLTHVAYIVPDIVVKIPFGDSISKFSMVFFSCKQEAEAAAWIRT